MRPFTPGPPTAFQQLNAARAHWGLEPLPSDAELDARLQAYGITHCEGKKYPWA